MLPKAFPSVTDQVADQLRLGILEGRWREALPGRQRLAEELGCGHCTVEEAIQRLTREGLLIRQGPGRRRRIVCPEGTPVARSLRVMLLLYEQIDQKVDYIVDLQHRLLEAGHIAEVAPKALLDLKMDVARVARMVHNAKADAWVIQSGSADVLEWFAGQSIPAFALAGRRRSVRIAGTGPDKLPALRTALRHLVELGHRRIVMIAREERRKPGPGLIEQAFLHDLEALGIATGSYNLPDWDDSPEGLYQRLGSLFHHSPPTALIMGEEPLFLAVERHLGRLGLLVPRDVSLVCMDPSPVFRWFRPSVAHIHWDSRPMARRIVTWATHVARGREDFRQTSNKASFVDGGTIGPVPVTR